VNQPVPQEWLEFGYSEGDKVSIDVNCSLFNLLGDKSKQFRENVVRVLIYQLSQVDPPLALALIKLKERLTSTVLEDVVRARKQLAAELLKSGYFDLQRDLAHAIRRYHNYAPDQLNRFLGFVGEKEAETLSDNDFSAPYVKHLGSLSLCNSHFSARVFLSSHFGDAFDLHREIQALANPEEPISDEDSERSDKLVVSPSSFEEWIANRVIIAEESSDPFEAAWALRQLMIASFTQEGDLSFTVDGNSKLLDTWIQSHILRLLENSIDESSELNHTLRYRRRLAGSALSLAGWACGSQRHFSEYDEEDPLMEWLDHTWILSNKIQIALIDSEGSLEKAAEKAYSAICDLSLNNFSPGIPDAFDPFIYGTEEEDLGVALTLTAILETLKDNPEELPSWWNEHIRDVIESLSISSSSQRRESGNDEIENRLNLNAPLRTRCLQERILGLI
jgi:hypothetical protein